jgi:hypothetical protein
VGAVLPDRRDRRGEESGSSLDLSLPIQGRREQRSGHLVLNRLARLPRELDRAPVVRKRSIVDTATFEDGAADRACHPLHRVRRAGLALGDEFVRGRERHVPAAAHEVDPDEVAADEAVARGVAVALREARRFAVELLAAREIAVDRCVYSEVVDRRRCHGRVDCKGDLEPVLHIREPRRIAEISLRHADGRERVCPKLIEAEVLGDRKRRAGEAQRLVWIA